MEGNPIIGISVLLFIYGLFSWSLGRLINKRKKKEATELQNFLDGAWILGIVALLIIGFLYYDSRF
ncbi:MAG: hypothetical protein CVU09_16110 [Bacteroidetes bacterium HGW-Bacteroidetes-4]|jgi:hypothetical protein|nr:MAG: hypothetical protein CVU09_16110 [Bacteroidetes bacterium HGW-Bacteroidetes-4]